jgi:hypothetical protein
MPTCVVVAECLFKAEPFVREVPIAFEESAAFIYSGHARVSLKRNNLHDMAVVIAHHHPLSGRTIVWM